MKYDFSGRAASTGVRCTDGTIFHSGAFDQNDGKVVPLVWMHQHTDPSAVLGKALLKRTPEGDLDVFGAFNNTPAAQDVKEMVAHGDVNQLSIWANHLNRRGNDLYNGDVKEVSLVLAGSDPTARIEQTTIMHSDMDADGNEDISAQIYSGDLISNTPGEIDEVQHSDEGDYDDMAGERTVGEVFDTLDDEQKDMVYTLLDQVAGAADDEDYDEDYDEDADDYDDEDVDDEDYDDDDYDYDEDVEHFDGGEGMYYNVFEGNDGYDNDVISHDDMTQLATDSFRDIKQYGSLKDSIIAHADQDYGITDIDILFPDAKTLTDSPDFIKRETEWVKSVLNGTKHIPFTRVKSVFANLTADEARARGYVKGKKKVEEVITLLKRSTDPQTIYKKQKLDRDDIIDVTSFDVVAWLKGEMRIMLDEEIAGAILVGDGRESVSDDKISEDHIRPIVTDDDLYAYKIKIDDITDATTAKAAIRAIILGYKNYKGSGNKTLFIKESALAQMLLIEDGIGHLLYANQNALATTLRVNKIVEIPDEIFERNKKINPVAVIIDLSDYVVGADKGGSVSMFDDFDIDYNQQKYLIETRCSGALVKPFSAMVLSTTTQSELEFKSPIKVDINGKQIKDAAASPTAEG